MPGAVPVLPGWRKDLERGRGGGTSWTPQTQLEVHQLQQQDRHRASSRLPALPSQRGNQEVSEHSMRGLPGGGYPQQPPVTLSGVRPPFLLLRAVVPG